MMDIGALLKAFIYLVSSSLLYPVLLLLALLILVTIVQAGSFFAECLERFRMEKGLPQDLPNILKTGNTTSRVSHHVNRYIRAFGRIESTGMEWEAAVENLLRETTLSLRKSLDRYRILIRVAPSLGLIGTLIPMGTGLAALGQGDMTRLSTDLVIAFTTTVVGLAVGTTAFFLHTVRRRWVEEDIKNMELATDVMMENRESENYEILSKAANS